MSKKQVCFLYRSHVCVCVFPTHVSVQEEETDCHVLSTPHPPIPAPCLIRKSMILLLQTHTSNLSLPCFCIHSAICKQITCSRRLLWQMSVPCCSSLSNDLFCTAPPCSQNMSKDTMSGNSFLPYSTVTVCQVC